MANSQPKSRVNRPTIEQCARVAETRSWSESTVQDTTDQSSQTFVTCAGRRLRIHPLAAIIPRMPAAEFERLKASIKAAGKNQIPVIIDRNDQILDGRHRLAACVDLQIEPVTTTCAEGESIVDLILDANAHRRHLNSSQRALIAARIASLGRGRPGKKAHSGAFSQTEAAEKLGISRTQLQAARRILNKGVLELVELIEDRLISLKSARFLADLPVADQRELIASGIDSVRARVHELRSQAARKREPRKQIAVEEQDNLGEPRPTALVIQGDDSSKIDDLSSGSEVGEKVGIIPETEETVEPEESEVSVPIEPEPTHASETVRRAKTEAVSGADTAAGATEVSDFETWLAERPLGQDLEDRTHFDREARIWFELRPVLERIRREGEEDPAMALALNPPAPFVGSFGKTINYLIAMTDPDQWSFCPFCEGGKSSTQASCDDCYGRGYSYHTERPWDPNDFECTNPSKR